MFASLLALAAPLQGVPTGTLPDLTYDLAEVFQQISPDLNLGVHHNQPHGVDGRLFLSGNGHQEIWDISDPRAPFLVSTMQSPHDAGEAEGHQVSFARIPDGKGGWEIYASTISGRGIDLWNITDPAAPVLASAIELDGIQYGDSTQAVWGVSWQGRYVYVGGTNTGLHVVDALDPFTPVVVTRMTTADLGGISAGPVFAMGDLLVLSTPKGSSGIATIDISDPTAPTLLDVERPITGGSYIGWFYGTHTYLQTPLRVFDVTTDPSNITLVGTTQTPLSEYMNFAEGKLFLGSLRELAGGLGGVLIYDLADPTALSLVGHVEARDDPRTDDQFSVPIGNLLVVSDDEAAGLRGTFLAPLSTDQDRLAPEVMYMDPPDGSIGLRTTSRVGFSFSDQIELATLDPASIIVRPLLGGPAVEGRFGLVHTVASFTPDTPLAPDTAYEVVLPAGGVKDLVGNGLAETFRSTFRTGSDDPSGGLSIAAPPPSLVGETASFAVPGADPQNLTYEWDFGDGSALASGPAVTHTFAEAGRYGVRVTSSVFVQAATGAEQMARTAGVSVETLHGGYLGSGYAQYAPGAVGSGVRLSWSAAAPSDGGYRVRVRYSNDAPATRRLRLRVNGVSKILYLNPTGDGSIWNEANVLVQMRAGSNIIDLLADVGTEGVAIDEVVIEGLSASTLQAEALPAGPGVAEANSRSGFRGTGYAAFPVDEGPAVAIEGDFSTATGGSHLVRVRYASDGLRRMGLYVNGAPRTEIALPPTAGEWLTTTVAVALDPGTSTLALAADAGTPGADIDEIEIDAPPPRTTATVTHIVHRPVSLTQATRSSTIVHDAALQRIFVANPDSDTVSAVDVATRQVVFEVPVGDRPVSAAVYHPTAGAPELWIANAGSHELTVLDAANGDPIATIPMPYASEPQALALSPDGSTCFVALGALGRLVRVETQSRLVTGTVELEPGSAPRVRALAVTGDGATVLAPRFVSEPGGATVYAVDAQSLQLLPALDLPLDPGPDTPDSGRGVPNHLAGITISPSGDAAWVPGIKSNVLRGVFREGRQLLHDSTVRPMLARIDLLAGVEDTGARLDLNDADSPVAVESSALGDIVFVAVRGLNQVDVRDVRTGEAISSLVVGRAPSGLVLDGAGVLWVHDQLDRQVTALDVSSILSGRDNTGSVLATVSTVAQERLAPEVLLGKQIFHDASDPRMGFEGYLSCASCHVDGADDGQVWDFTGRGEGLRNTVSLIGRGGTGHGPLHWTGNFDEVQDFENDIRAAFGGTGFMADADFESGTRSDPLGDTKAGLSTELDALSAYVASLAAYPPSPYRNQDGTLTPEAVSGKLIFESLDCSTCHAGPSFTDSGVGPFHDVGTIMPSSGTRRGEPLLGFDTPTLRSVWASPPYFHDGSAATLGETLLRPGHGGAASLPPGDFEALVAYLKQLDGTMDFARMGMAPCGPSEARLLGSARLIPARTRLDAYALELPAGDSTAGARWTVRTESAVTRTVRILGRPRSTARLEVWVNGVRISQAPPPGTPASTLEAAVHTRVPFAAGVNEIEVRQVPRGPIACVLGVVIQ